MLFVGGLASEQQPAACELILNLTAICYLLPLMRRAHIGSTIDSSNQSANLLCLYQESNLAVAFGGAWMRRQQCLGSNKRRRIQPVAREPEQPKPQPAPASPTRNSSNPAERSLSRS